MDEDESFGVDFFEDGVDFVEEGAIDDASLKLST